VNCTLVVFLALICRYLLHVKSTSVAFHPNGPQWFSCMGYLCSPTPPAERPTYNFGWPAADFSSSTSLKSDPIPFPNQTTISSPCFKKTGGFLTKPTPLGVPVMIMLPGSRVVPCERNETVCRTLKICSLHETEALSQILQRGTGPKRRTRWSRFASYFR
jgi:hypothetical protein